MTIGIHDSEKEHFKKKTFPNYALMKISATKRRYGRMVGCFQSVRQGLFF